MKLVFDSDSEVFDVNFLSLLSWVIFKSKSLADPEIMDKYFFYLYFFFTILQVTNGELIAVEIEFFWHA